VLEWRSESSEIFVLSTRLFFFGYVCFEGLVKMFYIRITIRWYFASLSIDICALHLIFFEIFVSEIVYFIHQIVIMVQSVWHSLSLRNNLHVRPRKANNGRCPLSEAMWL